jgi:hypothetical protein
LFVVKVPVPRLDVPVTLVRLTEPLAPAEDFIAAKFTFSATPFATMAELGCTVLLIVPVGLVTFIVPPPDRSIPVPFSVWIVSELKVAVAPVLVPFHKNAVLPGLLVVTVVAALKFIATALVSFVIQTGLTTEEIVAAPLTVKLPPLPIWTRPKPGLVILKVPNVNEEAAFPLPRVIPLFAELTQLVLPKLMLAEVLPIFTHSFALSSVVEPRLSVPVAFAMRMPLWVPPPFPETLVKADVGANAPILKLIAGPVPLSVTSGAALLPTVNAPKLLPDNFIPVVFPMLSPRIVLL